MIRPRLRTAADYGSVRTLLATRTRAPVRIGDKVGTPSCWFNPSTFAVPPGGQFGNAGRISSGGPGFAQFDGALHKDFAISERRKITVGAEAYNLFNHPNFGVPSNTQSPLSMGGNGDGGHRVDATNGTSVE